MLHNIAQLDYVKYVITQQYINIMKHNTTFTQQNTMKHKTTKNERIIAQQNIT